MAWFWKRHRHEWGNWEWWTRGQVRECQTCGYAQRRYP